MNLPTKQHMLVMHRVPGAVESRYQYDHLGPTGNVIRNELSTGEVWLFDYRHQHTIVTDHLLRQTRYDYDSDNYLTGTTNALGHRQTLTLDQDGLPLTITDEAGGEQHLYYDSRGNPVLIKAPDGSGLQVSYHDDFNLPVDISDDVGNTTEFAYDDNGNLITETAADGSQTHYQY